jgi:phage portal protein BeeE
MYSVNPKAIQVERNEAGVKTAYSFRNRRGAIRENIEANGRCRILEIKYSSSRNVNGLDGFVSPCRLVRTAVKLYNDINQHNALMVKHYPRLGGVLLAESMTNSQHEVSREVLDWKSKIPGYIPILRGKDMDFEYDNHVKNCDYLDGKRDAGRQIMEIFGIPETLMNPSGTAHNYAQILKHFREDTLCPLAEKIAHRLEGWLNNFMPVKFVLNLDKIGYSPDQMLDKINTINDCDFIDNETKREICEIDE